MQTKSEVSGQGSSKTDKEGRQGDQNGKTAEHKDTQRVHSGGTECFQFGEMWSLHSSPPTGLHQYTRTHTHYSSFSFFLSLLFVSIFKLTEISDRQMQKKLYYKHNMDNRHTYNQTIVRCLICVMY